MATDSGAIPILVDVVGKGGASVGVANIPVDTLRANFRAATGLLSEALGDIREVGQYELSEVEVSVQVSAEGGVQFIGTAKVSGSGTFKLKFKKPERG